MEKYDIIRASDLQDTLGGLQTALNGKSDTGHTHTINQVSGLQSALNDLQSTVKVYSMIKISSDYYLEKINPNTVAFIRVEGTGTVYVPTAGGYIFFYDYVASSSSGGTSVSTVYRSTGDKLIDLVSGKPSVNIIMYRLW